MMVEIDNPKASIDVAKAMAIAGDIENAASTLLAVIRAHPMAVEAHYLLGIVHITAGKDVVAGVEMRRSVILAPDAAKPWRHLGEISYRLGDKSAGVHHLWRSYNCTPDDVILVRLIEMVRQCKIKLGNKLFILLKKVMILRNEKVFRKFVDILIQSEEINTPLYDVILQLAVIDHPSNVQFYQHMARERVSRWSSVHRQKSRLRLLKFGDASADILRNIAVYMKNAEQYHMASVYLRRAILYSPSEFDTYYRLFFLKRNQGALGEARSYLRKTWCALLPDEKGIKIGTVLNRFAELERASGDSAPLIPRFKEALSRVPPNGAAWRGMTRELARCQIEAGDSAGSLGSLKALERFRSNAPSTYLLSDWSSHFYRSGERHAYDRLVDRTFIQSYDLATVDPELDVHAFNAALRRCITTHPSLTLRGDGGMGDYRQTRDKGPGSLLEDQTPELVCLRGYFDLLLSRYRDSLPDDPHHPFLKFKNVPAPISLFWGLVNRNNIQIHSHCHYEDTFMTGIYYAHEAEDVFDPTNPRSGWFEALRSDLNISMAPEDVLEFETRPGRFLFLPAYFFHRAMPTKLPRKRVSIVADFKFTSG